MLLSTIKCPSDIKKMNVSELSVLAEEMRAVLIKKLSKCGGHLGSNLGVVELTIALHYVFDSPHDKFVFDVSHQSYCHKMITGRVEAYVNEDKYNDVTGFSEPRESEHDFFNIGHTSTAISLGIGLAKGRDVLESDENIIVIIGDGSLGGGQAFEGLNYATEYGKNLIIIVNDNDMSIAENHGGLYQHLKDLRESGGKAENNIFKAFGLEYHYLENGHDIHALISKLLELKDIEHPVVLHIKTQKGKGYSFAESEKEKWHQSRPFDVSTGTFLTSIPKENYGAIVGDYLLDRIKEDQSVVVVTAGTSICIGFDDVRRKKAGSQFIDVGIEEQNGVTITAALSRRGAKAVFATNSTFIQRAYDQIEQEMCITPCPATLIITHASVLGHNTVTHMGWFDIPLLSNIPNLVYLAPTNKEEYLSMIEWSMKQQQYPVAIRTPWNGVYHAESIVDDDYSEIDKYRITVQGSRVAIIAVGSFFQLGEKVVELLRREGINPTLINPRYLSGVDEELLTKLKCDHELIITLEDGYLFGGFGARIAQYYGTSSLKVMNMGFRKNVVSRYIAASIIHENGLEPVQIEEKIKSFLR